MAEEQQVNEDLEWHVIHGAPYFIREEGEGVFRIVCRTGSSLGKSGWNLHLDLDSNFPELVLNEDIEEFWPENSHLGLLVSRSLKLDFQIVRGLRHLARLEGALYVAYQHFPRNPGYGADHCYGTLVEDFKRDLVLARFFNRKYDTGIDPYVSFLGD